MNHQDFNPEPLYHQAIQAYQSGDFATAEKLLQDILEHLPEQDGIMSTLGGIFLAQGKIKESTEILEKSIHINPQNVDAQLNLGIAYQNSGRGEEGVQMIAAAAQLAPERADVQFNYANTLIQVQQYPEAIEILKKVIDLNPKFLQAYHTLASLYAFSQKNEEAIALYQKALENIPDDLNTLILLGNLFADIGQPDQAEATYLKAATAHPNHFLPYAVLGKLYLDIGKDQEAEQQLLKALTLNPNDLNTNILLGNFNKTLGKTQEAEKYYRQALVIDPQNEGALSNLRRLLSSKIPYWHFEMLADTKRNDAYQKAIEKVVKNNPVVLDIGTGSGLLAMMAARAGARKVIACELHQELAKTAKTITKLNGFEDVIEVHATKSTNLQIDEAVSEKADIIISEILDVGALGEGALPSIRHAIQNLAKPNVQLIPSRVQLYGQVIEIPARSMVAPIRKVSGFDLSPFEQFRIPNEYIKINLKAEKYKPLSAIFPILDIDFYNLPTAVADDQSRRLPLEAEITEGGMVQAVVFWFDLSLDDEIVVSSQPDGDLEHWGQALFCFEKSKAVQAGDRLPLTLLQTDQLIKFEL